MPGWLVKWGVEQMMKIPPIIAHRGASGVAPENTLAAFSRAADLGAKGVELDVNITSDGIAVVIHDETVERCSDGKGAVAEKTYSQIRELDAGKWFSDEFTGERIPTLKEAIDLIVKRGLFLNLEIKPSPGLDEQTAKVVSVDIEKYWPRDAQIIVSSFSQIAISAFHQALPHIPCGIISDNVPENWHQLLLQNDCVSFHMHYSAAKPDVVKDIKSAGYLVLAYTVDDPKIAKDLYAMGVDGIFTNFPEKF